MIRRVHPTGILSVLLSPLAMAQPATSPQAVSPPAPPVPPPAAVAPAEPEALAVVQGTGIEPLTDYANAGRLIGAAEGVRRVDVSEANQREVTFRVLVRGGSEALARSLESSAQLAHGATSSSGTRLVYEYRR